MLQNTKDEITLEQELEQLCTHGITYTMENIGSFVSLILFHEACVLALSITKKEQYLKRLHSMVGTEPILNVDFCNGLQDEQVDGVLSLVQKGATIKQCVEYLWPKES